MATSSRAAAAISFSSSIGMVSEYLPDSQVLSVGRSLLKIAGLLDDGCLTMGLLFFCELPSSLFLSFVVCFVALASARLCLASICFATFACAFLAIAARLRFAASRRALRSLHRSARVMPTPRTALMSCAAAKTIPARRNTVSHGTPIKASRHAIALVSSLARPACLLTNRAIAARLRFAASRRALRSLHRSARVMPTPRTALMSCAAAKTIPARRNTVSHGTPIKASRHAIALVSSLARPACLLTNRTRRARGTRAQACGETSDGCWFKRLLIDGEVLLAGPLKIHLYLSIVTVRVARATR